MKCGKRTNWHTVHWATVCLHNKYSLTTVCLVVIICFEYCCTWLRLRLRLLLVYLFFIFVYCWMGPLLTSSTTEEKRWLRFMMERACPADARGTGTPMLRRNTAGCLTQTYCAIRGGFFMNSKKKMVPRQQTTVTKSVLLVQLSRGYKQSMCQI